MATKAIGSTYTSKAQGKTLTAPAGEQYVNKNGTILLRPLSVPTSIPQELRNVPTPDAPSLDAPSNNYFAPLANEQASLNQQVKDTSLSRLDEDYSRFVKLSQQAEQQGLQSRQLTMEGALRRADVGYVNRGLYGTGGIQRYNQQDITQPAQLDMTQFQTQQQNSRDQAGITKQRGIQDVNRQFQQNTLNQQANSINGLFPQ